MEKWTPTHMSLVLTLILCLNVLISGLCLKPIDLVFVIDSSNSINYNDLKLQAEFVKDFVKALEIGPNQTRVAVVMFSADVYEKFEFDKYKTKKQVLQAIDHIYFTDGDATRTYIALERTHDIIFAPGHGERPDIANAVIVLTDGKTNPGSYDHHSEESAKMQTQIEAAKIRAIPADVYAIGVGSDVNIDELKGISSDPDDLFTFRVSTFQELHSRQVMNRILYTICSSTAIKPNTTTQGPTISTIKPNTTTQETTRSNCENADVMFLADSSNSIGYQGFKDLKTFAISVVRRIKNKYNDVHFGFIAFSDKAEFEFKLNTYTTAGEIINAINTTTYRTGNTSTHKALQLLVSKSFSRQNGGREGVLQIAIVLTDGYSREPEMTMKLAEAARIKGIMMFSLAVGPYINQMELNTMASEPTSSYSFYVDNEAALFSIEGSIANVTCRGNTNKTTSNTNRNTNKPTLNPNGCGNAAADVIFVADISTSIGYIGYGDLKKFAISVVKQITNRYNDVHFGLITFSDEAIFEFKLNTYATADEIIKAINIIPYRTGNTNTHKALQLLVSKSFSRQNGGREGVLKIAIVLTDGYSQEPEMTIKLANTARIKGIMIYSLAVGPYINQKELNTMASEPTSLYSFYVDNEAALFSIEGSIANVTCRGNTNKPTSNTNRNTNKPTLTPNGCENAVADVIFLADISTSIGYIGYGDLKEFAISVVKQITNKYNDVHFGLITFSDEAIFEFKLNTYKTADEIIKAINIIPYRTGNTNTHKALQLLVSNSFTRQNGGRERVPKIAIVVTDGKSSKPEMTIKLARTAHMNGILMFSIGVGPYIDQNELDIMASKPTSLYSLSVDNYAALSAIEGFIAQGTCRAASTYFH